MQCARGKGSHVCLQVLGECMIPVISPAVKVLCAYPASNQACTSGAGKGTPLISHAHPARVCFRLSSAGRVGRDICSTQASKARSWHRLPYNGFLHSSPAARHSHAATVTADGSIWVCLSLPLPLREEVEGKSTPRLTYLHVLCLALRH